MLLVEAMGDGTSTGSEMKRIADEPQRMRTREMFVLVMRWMMWAFELQKEHVIANKGFLWESRQVLDVPVH